MPANRLPRRPSAVRTSSGAGTRPRTRATQLLNHAAELLETEANVLRDSHTLHDRWGTDPVDRSAKRIYDDQMDTALRLRRLARGERL